jgi:hypothetical protein
MTEKNHPEWNKSLSNSNNMTIFNKEITTDK